MASGSSVSNVTSLARVNREGLASNRALAHDLATWHRPARNRNRLEAVVAHKGANPVGIFSRLGLSLRGDLQEE
jgi:hypothetical protein